MVCEVNALEIKAHTFPHGTIIFPAPGVKIKFEKILAEGERKLLNM